MCWPALVLLSTLVFDYSTASLCTNYGVCKDYRKSICTAGYEAASWCHGDSNIRCCKPCYWSCRMAEQAYARHDYKCSNMRGKCQDRSNYCGGSYYPGYCGGPSKRQCCIGVDSCYDDIISMSTSGASLETAKLNGLNYSGVAASHEMAKIDALVLEEHKTKILAAASRYCIESAVIAAIISRESRAGKLLRDDGFSKDGKRFGLMQINVGVQKPDSHHSADGQTHIYRGTHLLLKYIKEKHEQHPFLSKRTAYKFGIIEYDARNGVWNSGSTVNDYTDDVVARAQWFKRNGYTA